MLWAVLTILFEAGWKGFELEDCLLIVLLLLLLLLLECTLAGASTG